jgi:glycosyltransferase involved in cell wall biosynthesis
MIHLLVPPDRSGLDSLSPKSAASLHEFGIDATFGHVWSRDIHSFMHSGRIPFARRIFAKFLARSLAGFALSKVEAGDIAWILSFCVPRDPKPTIEEGLRQRGIRYIFHVMDDWFSIPELLCGTVARCQIADLVAVPTPQIAERVREHVPHKETAVFEEPIDLCRLRASAKMKLDEQPTILWCGNPNNLKHMTECLDALRSIHSSIPFTLRVISGAPPQAEVTRGLEIDWRPFNHENEGELISGSWFGIAPLPDTPYNRCKGAYKVKTYFGAGLPVVASPVGFQEVLVRASNGAGLLASTPEEWINSIRFLLSDKSKLKEQGAKALAYATARCSYPSVGAQWADILRAHFPESVKAATRIK